MASTFAKVDKILAEAAIIPQEDVGLRLRVRAKFKTAVGAFVCLRLGRSAF
jgi:hypothetical protein